MAAPQIPNLNSLRSGRGLRGRGRGGRNGLSGPSDRKNEDQDSVIQKTDSDASHSRMSAVELGYLEDPFAKAFVTEQVNRRFPIINRGTYVRSTAIDLLVDSFLSTNPDQPKQVISLGAGSDPRFFRILSKRPSIALTYHEIDFPANTKQKIEAIKRTPLLVQTITSHLLNPAELSISADETSLTSPVYNIHALDLRTLAADQPTTDTSTALPNLPNLSPTTSTLLLSECCLIYLSPNEADRILETFTSALVPAPTPVSLIIYEPIRPYDAFGKVMISNLATRGIVLQTLKKYSSLLRQRERLKKFGFSSGQGAADVNFIWEEWVSEDEKERVASLEMLDEMEEWVLLAKHYCVAWGWRDGNGDIFGKAWESIKAQDAADDEEMG
ncbi:S-adenosyl-L-methionine-dependent methyltransferase [Phyllosticta citricarpa]|uniref:Leucine carboxyl methyltransferase 1 n=1 Tax=Phyllosticta paracitricarpa TaxID=2016321 RepID=A0ABR1NHC8_9PEZI